MPPRAAIGRKCPLASLAPPASGTCPRPPGAARPSLLAPLRGLVAGPVGSLGVCCAPLRVSGPGARCRSRAAVGPGWCRLSRFFSRGSSAGLLPRVSAAFAAFFGGSGGLPRFPLAAGVGPHGWPVPCLSGVPSLRVRPGGPSLSGGVRGFVRSSSLVGGRVGGRHRCGRGASVRRLRSRPGCLRCPLRGSPGVPVGGPRRCLRPVGRSRRWPSGGGSAGARWRLVRVGAVCSRASGRGCCPPECPCHRAWPCRLCRPCRCPRGGGRLGGAGARRRRGVAPSGGPRISGPSRVPGVRPGGVGMVLCPPLWPLPGAARPAPSPVSHCRPPARARPPGASRRRRPARTRSVTAGSILVAHFG